MIDVTKIDDAIRYLDFEPKKKFGGEYRWLATLLFTPLVVALVVLLVIAVHQAKW